jgi:hypothetical protein
MHVVGTFNGNGTAKIYVNGNLENQAYDPTITSVDSNSRSIKIGNMQSSFEQYTNGNIDEVMIFNRTLSDPEILALYNSQVNNFEFSVTNLEDQSQYNYTIYSINTSGSLLQHSYNFFTNTTIEENEISLFPSFGLLSIVSLFSILLLFFR